MNFFALQQKTRRSSRWLVVLFALAVVAIILAIDLVVVLSGYGWHTTPDGIRTGLDYGLLGWISALVLAFIVLASLGRSMKLRAGGSAVAQSMGATLVTPDTTNPDWRRLRNVIEEIAIASGVQVPDIYVMENEDAINAFAAGYSPADAAVCVTQGCLDRLTRDELQGVIAHEFSHVLNGDMRLNIRLIGLLFGILVIGIVGKWVLLLGPRGRSRSSSGGSGGYIVMVGLGLFVVGYLGYFFGRLIQASVSRSREALADASAVQFTRQSAGIAGALKKIAAVENGSVLQARETEHMAHMLFGEGLKASRLFATHPPLIERIQALEPSFDPSELDEIAKTWLHKQRHPAEPARERTQQASGSGGLAGSLPGTGAMPGFPGGMGAAVLGAGAAATRHGVSAQGVTDKVATPGTDKFELAGNVHRHMPAPLADAARDIHRAHRLILAMALSRTGQSRQAQQEILRGLLDKDSAGEVTTLARALHELHPLLRLPLAALAFPSLKRLPSAERVTLMQQLGKIVNADGKIELDEYCLVRMVQIQVVDALDPAAAGSGGHRRLAGCRSDVHNLFALVARFGNADEDTARRAFAAACEEAMPGKAVDYRPPEQWQPALDRALDKLDRLTPSSKELLVRGLVRAVRFDGELAVSEAELLRVVCAALHCPLPPLLQNAGQADADDGAS